MEGLIIRRATIEDVPRIIELISQDQMGRAKDDYSGSVSSDYQKAFEKIDLDDNCELMVAELENKIVGTFQLNYLQYVSHSGGIRVLVEMVRVDKSCRNQGIGKKMLEYITQRARERGAQLIELTTNKKRSRAHKFYKSLGFENSHEGFKRYL
ncbi:MAG: GNAT family N-acetyltransferase [Bacteroidetes bacterium]|nr:GNAT family N-acetyltransferase [Bacteroidota bacterium]MDA1120155.1 GNAT family N-acetyltransferase [Bacteroidota bacterium]